MADIPPVTLQKITTATVATANLPATQTVQIVAEIQSAPDRIADLLRQLQLNGTPSSLQSDGTFTLRTAVGDLQLFVAQLSGGAESPLAQQLEGFIQNQHPLSLAIQPGSPPTEAILFLPAATKSLQPDATLTASLATDPKTATTTTLSTSTSTGSPISAFVLPQKFDAGLLQPALLEKQTGFTGATATPAFAADGTINSAKSQTTGNLAGANIQQQNPQNFSAPDLLLPGRELIIKIDQVISPNSAVTTPPAPDQVIATVVGKGANGQLILNSGDNSLFIRQNINLPIGARLLLSVEPATSRGETVAIANNPLISNLQQFIEQLHQIDPTTAQQFLQNHIPQPNASLAPALVFLLNAFAQNNFKGWLGETAASRLERAGKSNLLGKLLDELKAGTGVAHDAVVGEWKAMTIPIYEQNQFNLIQLYVRNDQHHQHHRENTPDLDTPNPNRTRFVLDLNFTRLGLLQMDGLVQKRQIDLVMRSERALPLGLPQELRQLYINHLSAFDLSGTINFQAGRHNWMLFQQSPIPSVSV